MMLFGGYVAESQAECFILFHSTTACAVLVPRAGAFGPPMHSFRVTFGGVSERGQAWVARDSASSGLNRIRG